MLAEPLHCGHSEGQTSGVQNSESGKIFVVISILKEINLDACNNISGDFQVYTFIYFFYILSYDGMLTLWNGTEYFLIK